MRWPERIPEQGETRYIWRGCWLPFKWQGITFWLETIYVQQRYSYRLGLGSSWQDIEVNGIKK